MTSWQQFKYIFFKNNFNRLFDRLNNSEWIRRTWISEHFSWTSLVSLLISPKILSSGLLEGPMFHGSGSVERGDYDGSLLTHVYFYSERACIMHVALTKHPTPDFTGVLSGVWFGLSSWVGWCIKFLEALLPPVYLECTYSQAASMLTQTHTHRVKHTHTILQYISHLIKLQMLCCNIHIVKFYWREKSS